MPPASRPIPPDFRLPDLAVAALQQGQKLEAIKAVREATGCGLKDAKDFVEEAIARDPHLRVQFEAAGAAQLRKALLILAALAALIATAVMILPRHT